MPTDYVLRAAWRNAGQSSMQENQSASRWSWKRAMWFMALCLLVFVVNGYHPHPNEAEPFVLSRVLADLMAHAGLPLGFVLLTFYLASIAAFLLACNLLSERLFDSKWARAGAMLLAAACFALPVVGTPLHLMEPYLTPRSIATPFGLFAIVASLDRSWKRCVVYLLLAAIAYPLEGLHFAILIVVYTLTGGRKYIAAATMCIVPIAGCALLSQVLESVSLFHANAATVLRQMDTSIRGIQSGEIVQFCVPIALLLISALRCTPASRIGRLSMSCMLIGVTAWAVSICFAGSSHSDILALLPVFQGFEVIDAIGVVILGGFLFSFFLQRGIWIGIAVVVMVFGAMFLLERQSYSHLPHIELPREVRYEQKTPAAMFLGI